MEGVIDMPVAGNLAAVQARIDAATQAAGRAPGTRRAGRSQQDTARGGGTRSASRGSPAFRREPGAGGPGEISRVARNPSPISPCT